MNDYRELHELYHFGILGMHWGIRRYQNPDGTLTAAGKKRLKQGDKVLNKVASSKTMNKMSSKMTDHVVKKMQEKSSKEDEEFNGSGQSWGRRKDYKNSDGTLNETGKERLRSLNEDYAYYQHIKKSMEDSERLMSGNLSDEESEYLSPSQKAFMKYVSKSPTFNALYKVSNNMSKPIMEQYKNNVDSKLKEFENRGITLKEIDKMRPLYMNNEYVKKVFKQFELSDELKHFGILGMHWGIRRYQNPDGTLTEAGKKRYDKLTEKSDEYMRLAENQHKNNPNGSEYALYAASVKAREKAKKYGTETPEERKATIERHRQEALERNKQKIEEANKIDLKDVKNKIPMKETKDKWEKAAKEDSYDLDFLEVTQNDYDEMPEEAAKKQRLKDYSDYLNAHKVSTMVIDKHKPSKELDDAAYLGMKAFMANGAGDEFQDFEREKEWFNYEDQTIGYTEVADLCKKMKKDGYGKDDVLNTLKSIDDNKFVRYFKGFNGNKEGLWDLQWFTGSEITGDYAQKHGKPGEKYIDALFAILESEGKIHHSAVDEIFEKFGII